jgi:hypothetical protein
VSDTEAFHKDDNCRNIRQEFLIRDKCIADQNGNGCYTEGQHVNTVVEEVDSG